MKILANLALLLQLITVEVYSQYTIVPVRTSNRNRLTLSCRYTSGSLVVDETVNFYRNENVIGTTNPGTNAEISYVIDFTNDGRFSCGVGNIRSESTILLPDRDFMYDTGPLGTEYAEVGQPFTMHPYLGPGTELDRYSIQWSQGLNIVSAVRRPILVPLPTGYSTDANTFALTIEDVRFDHAGDYEGKLSGRETENGFGQFYQATCNRRITLIVFEAPRITKAPTEEIITSRKNETAKFHCEASGYPAPIISWKINGKLSPLGSINSSTLGNTTTSSQLTLSGADLEGLDETDIECIASLNYPYPLRNSTSSTKLRFLEIESAIVHAGLSSIVAIVIRLRTRFEGPLEILIAGQEYFVNQACREDKVIVYVPRQNDNLPFNKYSKPDIKLRYNRDIESLARPAQLPDDECREMFLNIVIPSAIAATVVVVLVIVIAILIGGIKCCNYKLQIAMLKHSSEKDKVRVQGTVVQSMCDTEPREQPSQNGKTPRIREVYRQISENPSYGTSTAPQSLTEVRPNEDPRSRMRNGNGHVYASVEETGFNNNSPSQQPSSLSSGYNDYTSHNPSPDSRAAHGPMPPPTAQNIDNSTASGDAKIPLTNGHTSQQPSSLSSAYNDYTSHDPSPDSRPAHGPLPPPTAIAIDNSNASQGNTNIPLTNGHGNRGGATRRGDEIIGTKGKRKIKFECMSYERAVEITRDFRAGKLNPK